MGIFGSSQPDVSGWLMNLATGTRPQSQFGVSADPMQMATQQPNPSLAGPMAQLPTDPRTNMHPGFFGRGGMGGKMLMGALGGALDGVAQWGGARPGYANGIERQREEEMWRQKMEAERQQRMDELKYRHELDSNDPQAVNLGEGGFGVWTPNGGLNVIRERQQSTPDWDTYARNFGAPGSAQYNRAVQDYVLRSGGPTSMDLRTGLKQTVPGKAPAAGGGHAKTLKRGQVVNGHTYLGGDPNNRTSWR